MPVTLEGQTIPLPADYASTLLKNAFENSVISPLTSSEPLPLGRDTIIPQYDGGIEVGIVGEAQPKPVSTPTMTHQVLKSHKMATIVIVSKEMAQVDPMRMMGLIEQDLRNAATRAIDFGILYGKSAKTGAVIAGQTHVNQTTNRVELAAGDLVPQLLAAYDLAGEASDPSGWTFDTRFRTKVAMSTQVIRTPAGVPQPIPNLNTTADNVAGLPATYGRVVSGRVGNQAATAVKGFVGDWNKLRWGFADDISISRSSEATIVDGANTYHLFQDNLIALLVEFAAGWTILDVEAFAAIEDVTP